MAVRSIKLKLLVGRGNEESDATKRALWTTHRLFNEGVAYYMRWLVLMRQDAVPGSGIADPQGELLAAAREAQRRNGKASVGADEDLLAVFRELYEYVVPSSVGNKGDAQSLARAVLSPLTDSASEGGLGTSATGRKPAWQILQVAGDPRWKEAKEKFDKKKSEDRSPITEAKVKFGLLPLFASYSDMKKVWLKRSVCTTWDRDMFQQALERLLSWESWNRRVKTEHAKLKAKVDGLYAKNLDPMPDWALAMREYEKQRKADLDGVALPSDRPYRIMPRALRGWDRLREKWLKEKTASDARLWQIAAELQTDLRGGFGDPVLFQWLGKQPNRWIWDSDLNRVAILANLNALTDKLERAKTQADYTPPDPVHHPLWTRHDGRGGNIHEYLLLKDPGESGWGVKLKLLHETDGKIEEREETFPLAPSGQFRGCEVVSFEQVPSSAFIGMRAQKNDAKKQWLRFREAGTGRETFGKLGGAKVQFDRATLERNDKKRVLASGATGPAYFNVTVDLIPMVAEGTPQERSFKGYKKNDTAPWAISDFKDEEIAGVPLAQSRLGVDGLEDGLRVMSVDLGLRSLAACSVFSLASESTSQGLCYEVGDSKRFAIHERSFVLRLDGEKTTNELDARREAIVDERLLLRTCVRRLGRLLTLAGRTGEARQELLSDLRSAETIDTERARQVDALLPPDRLTALESRIADDDEAWRENVIAVHREWERNLGEAFSRWRQAHRIARSHEGIGGLSFWWIGELMETRRLMNSWSAHARIPGEIVRARDTWGNRKDLNAREVDLDRRLLEHINRLKNDRLKKAADQLVMAALGYVYEDRKSRWVAKYPPCRVILFEDLSRYRFRTDRPRGENSQLMKWGHRAIAPLVAMQGDIFGIRIGNVGAEFTSRFHASTGAPGVRAKQVRESDLDEIWFARAILRDMVNRGRLSEIEMKEILGMSAPERKSRILEYVRPGEIVAWAGGELFVTLGGEKGTIRVHADINAAQNIQRRFWTRYGDPVRLSCVGVDTDGTPGAEFFVPTSIGKRIERTLGYGRLVPDADGVSFRWTPLSKKAWTSLVGAKREDEDEDNDDAEDLGEELEALGSLTNERVTFFRDPSGTFFPSDRWIPSERFWVTVHARIGKALEASRQTRRGK